MPVRWVFDAMDASEVAKRRTRGRQMRVEARSMWAWPRGGRCPACGRPFARRDERIRIGGVVFHRGCAVYEPASRR